MRKWQEWGKWQEWQIYFVRRFTYCGNTEKE